MTRGGEPGTASLPVKGTPPGGRAGSHRLPRRPGKASDREQSVADILDPVLRRACRGDLPVGLRAWDGSEAGPPGPPTIILSSPDALRRLLWHPGELGAAQAYITGELDVEGDLAEGLRSMRRAARDRNLSRATLPLAGWAAARAAFRLGVFGKPPPAPAAQARVAGRLHSPGRDRSVIAHHYDVPAEFYRLFLDPAMAYSCGYWGSDAPGYTLADAQLDKLDLICWRLGLRPGARLLDVGCGWGSLAVHAASRYGARVDAVTLSDGQADFARRRARELGLGAQVNVLAGDYRDLGSGGYDAVACIEMGEHVGAREYPAFCARLRSMLRPGGRVLVQQMARRGRPGGGPFIESFVAPDMHMRPAGETIALLEDAGLEVRQVELMRGHYERTIRAWLARLEHHWDEAVALAGVQATRMWRLYLTGGALAFEEGRMSVHQILAARPGPAGAAPP